ncbi:hypothetical protein SAMN05444169_7386 [Bradyrhizobium erythrophlei]|jgi:hypothetical protein|uniref:Uncharacterized protein n=2 Tax=Bradyrhizobium erythrophlei TaxID=1437360 RepID=A0A1M5SVG0_9BRAD|nr:hypothetical protein SAMN05444169_7386 [Bradyrhizobium erythrophlei]
MVGVRAEAEVHASPRLANLIYVTYAKVKLGICEMIGRPETHPVKKVLGFTDEMVAAVESWRAKQKPVPNFSEAVRRLVELGLTVRTPAKPVNKPGRRLRAQELAANAIKKMIDPAAPPEERAQRKHRLTKGPSEFREDRVDLPKAKK